jgi:hypothetical protein
MRVLRVRPHQVWSALWPPLAATTGMVAVLVPIERTIDSPWPALIAGSALGGATYLLLLWVFARDALIRLREIARPPPVPGPTDRAPRETETAA